MDYTIDHAVNVAVRAHPLLQTAITGFASWGVTLFGVAAFVLWLLDPPRGVGVYRRACTAGLAAAALALLVNQVIAHLWHRARPYEAHPHGVIPLTVPSHDPSFPSDHASAAFAIAFGILFVAHRAGLLFLLWGALIAASRVLVGAHYPSDVLAGLAVGLVAGFLCARPLMPVLDRLASLVARVTDPVLAPIERTRVAQRTLGSPRFRRRLVSLVGAALLVVFAWRLRGRLVDELPLAVLALWAAVVAVAARIAGARVRSGGPVAR